MSETLQAIEQATLTAIEAYKQARENMLTQGNLLYAEYGKTRARYEAAKDLFYELYHHASETRHKNVAQVRKLRFPFSRDSHLSPPNPEILNPDYIRHLLQEMINMQSRISHLQNLVTSLRAVTSTWPKYQEPKTTPIPSQSAT